MQRSSSPSSPKRRAKFFIGGAIIAVALGGLVGWAMGRPGSTAFYVEVSELTSAGATDPTEELRVNGHVVAGSLERSGTRTAFEISDGADSVEIVTSQPLPDSFETGYRNDPASIEVVAQGRYDGEAFRATEVLAKCPSKYKTKA